MCNVCIATDALAVSRCGKESCKAFGEGFHVEWRSGPVIRQEVPGQLRKLMNNIDRVFFPEVYVRAKGRGAEFRPARFQLRRRWECWNGKWYTTKDLAGALGTLGLDTIWDCMPEPMKDYVLGRRRNPPSKAEIRRDNEKVGREIDALVDRTLCARCREVRRKKEKVEVEVSVGAGPASAQVPKPFCKVCERKLTRALREREKSKRAARREPKEYRLRIEDSKDGRARLTRIFDPARREEWLVAKERTTKVEREAVRKLQSVMRGGKVAGAKTWVKKTGKGKAQVMLSMKTKGPKGPP